MTVILSGDKTRRNMPGYAFRRAKARLMKSSSRDGLVNRGSDATGDTDAGGGGAGDQASGRATSSGVGGSREFKQGDENNLGDEPVRGAHLHRIPRALSRVTEEDSMSLGSSFVNSTRTFGGRDLESGAAEGSVLSPTVLFEGTEEEAHTGVGSGGGSKDVPWSPIRGGRIEERADDGGSNMKASSGRRQTRSGPPRDNGTAQNSGRLDSAQGSSIATRIADCSTSLWGESEDRDDSGDGACSPIPLRRNGHERRRGRSSRTLNRQRAIRNLNNAGSDVSECLSEGARDHNGNSRENATRDGIDLVAPFRRESAGRGRWPKPISTNESAGQVDGGGVDNSDGRTARPIFSRSSSAKVDIVGYSSGEDSKSNAATVAGSCERPSRLHRRGSLKDLFERLGVNTHSHSAAKKSRLETSRNRSSRNKETEDLSRSSLEDVRNLSYATMEFDSGYHVCKHCLSDANELTIRTMFLFATSR